MSKRSIRILGLLKIRASDLGEGEGGWWIKPEWGLHQRHRWFGAMRARKIAGAETVKIRSRSTLR
jgi:hypothetical protein